MPPDRLLDELRAVVGERHCLTDPDLVAGHVVDWTGRFGGAARAVVRPGSVDEVAAVLRACRSARVSVVPQGGNTGLVGGSVPRGGEVVLSLLRLREMEHVDTAAGELTVGAGTTLGAAQAHALASGWELGVDMGSRDSATIGGMVATNAGGVRVLRHGAMRRQVIGYEAVTAEGGILRRLPGMLKDNTGYDLGGLLAGSEGTLAVITRIRLRLVAPTPRRATALLAFGSAAAAVGAATDLRRRMPEIQALELLTDVALDLVVRHARLSRPFAGSHPALLLAETGAPADAPLDPADELAAAVVAVGAEDAIAADDEAGRRRIWELRERLTESVNAAGVPHKLDVSVPIGRYAALVDRLTDEVARAAPGAVTALYGHVGDGNVHVNVVGPPPDDETVDDLVLRLVLEHGGSISAEHGIGVAKVRWLERDRGAADVAAMRALKRALDPDGILNPGVIFADG